MKQLAESVLVLMFMVVVYAAIVLGSGARSVAWFLGALVFAILLAPILMTTAKIVAFGFAVLAIVSLLIAALIKARR